MKVLVVILGLGFALSAFADGSAFEEVETFLKRFRESSVRVMNERPLKLDRDGRVVQPESEFSNEQIESGDYVLLRSKYRRNFCMESDGAKKCLGGQEGPFANIEGNDRVEDLVGTSDLIRTLEGMESQALTWAWLKNAPWSDDYWPFYKGVIAARYADPYFPGSRDWSVNRNYIRDNPVSEALYNRSGVDLLSPAEKYELLIGDSYGNLSTNLWDKGAAYYNSTGRVETWMGICEGWAPASFMYSRPAAAVTLPAADGRTWVKFYPSDIKALASLMWASGSPYVRFIGGRCEVRHPYTDAAGRVIAQECFDTNPGTWHLAITNQLGRFNRSFVMDATYDYEVWNQPVVGYTYSYFNPQTTVHGTLANSKIPVRSYTHDPFPSYRSRYAVSIVGIVMDVTYVEENKPSHLNEDGPVNDILRTVRYHYDLELDGNGRIIGGEWYTNRHPDFLWTPPPGSRPSSIAEGYATGYWDARGPIPWEWTGAAQQAAANGQPLEKIVSALVARSNALAALPPPAAPH